MPLPTATQIKDMAVKGITGPSQDTKIEILIAAADVCLATWCLFPSVETGVPPTLEASPFVQFRHGPAPDDAERVDVKLRPITEITSVTQDIDGLWTYSETWTENTDFALEGVDSGSLYRIPSSLKVWIRGRRAIRIAGTFGYDVGADGMLTLAIAMQVGYWWNNPGAAPVNIVNTTQGGVSVARVAPSGAPIREVQAMLQGVKLWERQSVVSDAWRPGGP